MAKYCGGINPIKGTDGCERKVERNERNAAPDHLNSRFKCTYKNEKSGAWIWLEGRNQTEREGGVAVQRVGVIVSLTKKWRMQLVGLKGQDRRCQHEKHKMSDHEVRAP